MANCFSRYFCLVTWDLKADDHGVFLSWARHLPQMAGCFVRFKTSDSNSYNRDLGGGFSTLRVRSLTLSAEPAGATLMHTTVTSSTLPPGIW